jgi:hypothetical protein
MSIEFQEPVYGATICACGLAQTPSSTTGGRGQKPSLSTVFGQAQENLDNGGLAGSRAPCEDGKLRTKALLDCSSLIFIEYESLALLDRQAAQLCWFRAGGSLSDPVCNPILELLHLRSIDRTSGAWWLVSCGGQMTLKKEPINPPHSDSLGHL